MPIVQAYQCPKTAKLFATKEEYRQHLDTLARQTFIERKVRRNIATLDETFAEMRRATTIEDIVEWIEEHQEVFWINACYRDGFFRPENVKYIDPTGFRFYDIEIDVRWSNNISNTHNAPFGKPTNWHRKPELPMGYPGFRGSIRYRKEEPQYRRSARVPHVSFNLRGTGLETGSGGGRGGCYRYELYLFADDWPSLAVAHELRREW